MAAAAAVRGDDGHSEEPDTGMGHERREEKRPDGAAPAGGGVARAGP